MSEESKHHKGVMTNATERLVTILKEMDRNSTAQNVAMVLTGVLKLKDPDPNRAALLAFSTLTGMIEAAEEETRQHYAAEWDTISPHFAGIRACFTPSK